jgi:glycosyltransferase involved in cell wall biosynthesis
MTRPQIGVNARFLLPDRLEGIGRFSHEVLQRLVVNMSDVDFHFYFDRPYSKKYVYASNVIPHHIPPPARHPLLWLAWFELGIPYILSKTRAQAFFSPDGYLCLNTKIPQFPVFHDIAFEHYPKDISAIYARYYQTFFPRFARKAKQILTVSEFSKLDIIEKYHINAEKITVIGNGCSEIFSPIPATEYNKLPYFLYAGAIQPRKNLENLLLAYDKFRDNYPSRVILKLTGRKAWNFENIISTYENMKYKSDVIFTGFVSDSELNRLYAGALALCYVSRFEGFGLPILEAFHAGTPVITSTTSSMPEVAGNAALLVNPEKVEEITQAMLNLALHPTLRQELIQNGNIQKNKFSWEKTSGLVETILRKSIQ